VYSPQLDVISAITEFLNRDEGLTLKEKARSFELFLAEVEAVQVAEREKGKGRQNPERRDGNRKPPRFTFADEQNHLEQDVSGDESSLSSDFGEDEPRKRRKLRQSDMPWFGRPGDRDIVSNPSCVKSANLIRKPNRDIKSARLYIRLAPGAPRGVPMSEWDHIFKGEAVDLDKMLSSLHCVTIDLERKASIGEAEISIGGAEAKRKVESSSEWSTAWRSAARAIAFVFEHRQHELAEYGDYIERLFAAKKNSCARPSHPLR
jgi:hypothetical protein